MAADRIIRKKFNKTVCRCLLVDLNTGVSFEANEVLDGRRRFIENRLMREVNKSLPAKLMCIKILSISYTSEHRVMTEDFFLANSKLVEKGE